MVFFLWGRWRYDVVAFTALVAAVVGGVVPPGARIEGRSAPMLHLRRRYGAALIALARQGQPVRERLATVHFKAGDVLLLQGEADALPDTVATLGCLPLAERGLSLGRPRQVWLPIAIFAAAVIALVLFNRVTPREAYETIDWSVIILLGAMIPLGGALQATGGTQLIAGAIVGLAWGGADLCRAGGLADRDDDPVGPDEQCGDSDCHGADRSRDHPATWCQLRSVPDGDRDWRLVRFSDADWPSKQCTGDGPRRLQIRRLLAHGPAARGVDRHRLGAADPDVLAALGRSKPYASTSEP